MNKILLPLVLVPALACASPRTHEGAAVLEPHVVIQDDYDAALELARESERPLLVNFSGQTCVNCRRMETRVFAEAAVSEALEPYVEARLFVDMPNSPYTALQREWTGSVAVPTYVLVDPATGTRLARHDGPAKSAEFARFLADSSR